MGGMPMGGDASSMPMPGAPMGDPNMMGGAPMGGAPMGDPNMMGGAPMMGSQGNEGFDMGIGSTPEEDPKKWIEGAAAKLASELRKYQKSQPSPDMSTSKTAVNTVASASKEGLDDGQKNELMKSYADTMRGDGNGSDGAEDFGDTEGNDDGMDMGADGGDMGGDPNAMGGDISAGDPNAMGGQTPQQMMENRINNMVSEMLSDITKKEKKKPSTKVKHQEQSRTGYPFAPYTAKPNK